MTADSNVPTGPSMTVTKYAVQFLATASHVITVEAADPQEAMDKADRLFDGGPGLCHHCSRDMELGEFEADDSARGVWEV